MADVEMRDELERDSDGRLPVADKHKHAELHKVMTVTMTTLPSLATDRVGGREGGGGGGEREGDAGRVQSSACLL